jgi:hypothetical protein
MEGNNRIHPITLTLFGNKKFVFIHSIFLDKYYGTNVSKTFQTDKFILHKVSSVLHKWKSSPEILKFTAFCKVDFFNSHIAAVRMSTKYHPVEILFKGKGVKSVNGCYICSQK